jgi:hypothetical protein
MNITNRLVQFILRGSADKFKTVLQEELKERTSIILENMYKSQGKAVLNREIKTDNPPSLPSSQAVVSDANSLFIPESAYKLRDGNVGILSETEKTLISKLHESLNNDSKERMVKLLSESQESFNKILKLAKTENKTL